MLLTLAVTVLHQLQRVLLIQLHDNLFAKAICLVLGLLVMIVLLLIVNLVWGLVQVLHDVLLKLLLVLVVTKLLV